MSEQEPVDEPGEAAGRGAHDVHRQPLTKTLGNLLLLLIVPLPSLVVWWRGDLAHLHPVVVVNILFLCNVCVLFWLISLVQKSAWMIDPYWSLLPLFIGHYYASHPDAVADRWRSGLALAIVWVWSLRLTHNYLRREKYQLGVREDWRFAVRRASSKHFWWFSFFYAFISQQLMLAGLTLPLWAVHQSAQPFGIVDGAIALFALAGVLIAAIADTQLEAFMEANRQRRRRGEAPVLILETGLWRYARHPNYFGEQLFWWALAAWGVWVGQPWTVIGTVINTAGFIPVTQMTEARMTERPERRAAWEAYKARTSVWIPWPPKNTA